MGYKSTRAHKLKTIRGTSEIDVYAIKHSMPIPTVVLCECKHWDKPVPQNVIHGFRTVCSDAGAHFGIIISKRGFQHGAEESRIYTNIHLMNFDEFQCTFFNEWKTGAMMMLAKMHDQLLPIFRTSRGIFCDGNCEQIDKNKIHGVDVFRKYAIFFGEGVYSDYFIGNRSFPATVNDPRGNPHEITRITINSHREYLEIARRAVVDGTSHFKLPTLHFSKTGQELSS